jgi:NADP-dependent 3-hydroxy acid dehydrogenase YdfG
MIQPNAIVSHSQATQALAVNGAKVYIVGRTEEKLKTVQQTYGKDIAGEIIPLVGDVTKKSEIEKLVKEIETKEGFLDILFNSKSASDSPNKPRLTILRCRH